MAQLVIAAAGAAIGGMIAPGIVAFGMTGASLGWMAGSMIGSAFAPTQKSSGPQLSDLSVSTSAYGTPIPYVQGHPRIAGQIVWASTKREIATTTEQGKGGGGSEYTSYTYEVDLLILLSDNEIAGVRRIWSNGEVIWSAIASAGQGSLLASATTSAWSRLTIYTGSASQFPDPTYEAAVGTANAPAYRGRGAVFIQSLQLGGGGQIPNLTFEVVASGVANTSTVGDGVLCHFDAMSGANVQSALGPNLELDSAFGTALQTSTVKFGAAAGNSGRFFTLGVTGQLLFAKAWRAEGWFYPSGATVTQLFTISAAGSNRSFSLDYALGSGPSNDRFRIYVQSDLYPDTATGGYSQPNNIRLSNTWVHIAVQFVPARLATDLYVNGYLIAQLDTGGYSVGGVPVTFNKVDINGCICDEFFYRFIEVPDLYPAGALGSLCYGVPSSPFSAAGVGIYSIEPNTTPLQSVVDAVVSRTGLQPAQFETTALAAITRPVRSMAISSVSSARTVLDMLASSYHFEAVLSDKIYFRPRASAPAATLTFNELGVVVDSGSTPDPLPLTQANELEIPAQMALTYSNVDGDYQTDTQYSDRLLTGQESTSAMTLPLGFTSSEAKQIVDAMLLDKAVSALTTSVSLGLTRAALEPTDVVLLTGEDGSSYRMRIVKKAEASGVTTFDCVQDDATVFAQVGTTAGGTASQTTVLATPTTTLELLDVPLLRDVDNLPGHYAAVKGSASNWTSCGLYDSLDDLTYTPNTTISSQAVIGTCTTTLATWAGGNVFDESSSVTVNVGTQQLSSVTRDDILASQSTNAALIGSEVLQYRNATLVSAGVYTLSGFLRGQRGTASTGHATTERFVLLAAGGLRFVPLQQGDLGRTRYYKAASAGQKLSAVTSQSLTPAGITLKPFAPVDCRANRATADTVLTWTRQTRLSTRIVGTLGISSPLGEATEAYEVEIYTAGHAALLRTLSSTTPVVTYTSAQQVTDFGSNQTALAVKIYQISATIGRGTPLITTV